MTIQPTDRRRPRTTDPSGTGPVLEVRDLSVRYGSGPDAADVLRGVSFRIGRGETVALVGESGSGKSTVAHAVLALLPRAARVVGGSVTVGDVDLSAATAEQVRSLRGRRIALVPQDPAASLDPVMRIGPQVSEVLRIHRTASRREAARLALDALALAGLEPPEHYAQRYPHELSGGMRQRVLIAAAVVAGPELIIADEPTSALDATVQQRILDHLELLRARTGASMLFVTHDLAVAAERADRVLVLDGGRIVEQGAPATLFARPEHPRTRALVAAVPGALAAPAAAVPRPEGPATLLRLEDVGKTFAGGRGRPARPAVDGVDLTLDRGRTLALVGESGSGKTTVGRLILRLIDPDTGRIVVDGHDITADSGPALREVRRRIQLVQQNPFTALNPRLTVGEIIADPLHARRTGSVRDRRSRAAELAHTVQLPAATLGRRPGELSGGQRQRVAIARALAPRPELVVLDEPVSALDVSVQSRILELLRRLQDEERLGFLFITHDLAVARDIAHEVAVMRAGRIVESGQADAVFAEPGHPYTRALLDAVPDPLGRRTAPAQPLQEGGSPDAR